jgi:YHS domain-containing protein
MTRLALMTLAATLALTTHAGTFNERDGVAIRGHDPVAYFTQGKPVAGKSDLRHEHQGSTFLFASATNRDAFAADAAKYAPQYGGYCAFGVSRGYKADIDPAAFTIVGGKLYLNYNARVQQDWLKDTAGYIGKADAKWAEVAKTDKVHR